MICHLLSSCRHWCSRAGIYVHSNKMTVDNVSDCSYKVSSFCCAEPSERLVTGFWHSVTVSATHDDLGMNCWRLRLIQNFIGFMKNAIWILYYSWDSSAGKVSYWKARCKQYWRGFESSVREGTFLPESTSSADSVTVSVQPSCTIACINICVHIKNPKL